MQRRKEGVLQRDIAREFGLTRGRVGQILARLTRGFETAGEIKQRRNAMMLADMKAGMTREQIAEKYGLNPRTVGRICGVFQRPERPSKTQARNYKIVDDIRAGRPIEDIAKEHGLSTSHTMFIARKVGVSKVRKGWILALTAMGHTEAEIRELFPLCGAFIAETLASVKDRDRVYYRHMIRKAGVRVGNDKTLYLGLSYREFEALLNAAAKMECTVMEAAADFVRKGMEKEAQNARA